MYPLQGGVSYEESGYSPSVLDPTLMAPSGGAYSPGTSFGGGISFYGGSGGTTGGYASTNTKSVYRPPTTTASPYYGGTATASPAPFPSAPGTPDGSASMSPPALNPLAAAGGATGIGAPHHAAPAGLQPLNNNPYAASIRAYTAPVSPLAGIRAADQSHGGPTLQAGAQQAITSNGMDNTPVGVPHFGVAGASGFHGGMGNMPPTQAPAPPLSHVPFSAMVAYNGNGGNQGAGTANRDNLQAQSPTRGQGLQQSPPPPLFKPPPKNVMVPPPPPVAVPLGNPAVAMGMPGQPQMPVDPNEIKLDASTQGVLNFMQQNTNRSIVNADRFQKLVKEGQAKLDKAAVQFLASQVVGPQKAVDMYEKPGAAGLSLLEMSDEMLKDAIDARARQQEIHAGRYDLSIQNKARLLTQAGSDANKIPVPGQNPDVQHYLQATRGAEIEQAMMRLAPAIKAASIKAENERETDALKKSTDILNGYHKALADKAAAWKNATDVIEARQKAFWENVDQMRKNESNLDSTVQTYLKTWSDIEQSRQSQEYRDAMLGETHKANELHATLAQQNVAATRLRNLETLRANAQKELDTLNLKKVPSANKSEVEEQKIMLKGKMAGYDESIKQMGGI